ncbi:Acetyltransferase (GNAT) domain [Carpediemonas membranifera]|uniref:Acetyltransferase (GNAT) domain n=1 Tax=Carpediemonas membranifera TaxID=201153 RepID=A0A8J6AU34_9EUKA|nr:Acetyltransferase (GNAT) domain [Carpediemonas membranifera]|eukprot:KAG9391575.1 Acetyltransferase (GNAT) domain [Carpediemonas membranifera]
MGIAALLSSWTHYSIEDLSTDAREVIVGVLVAIISSLILYCIGCGCATAVYKCGSQIISIVRGLKKNPHPNPRLIPKPSARTDSIAIAPQSTDDTDLLVDIWFRASLQAHGFLGAARLESQREAVRDVYFPQAETWVATDGSKPVGFISLLGAHIGALFVDPPMQGRGIGRRLIAQAGAVRGALSVEVYAENRAATAFYRRQGFVETGRRPVDDNGLPHPLIRMERA